MAKFYGKDPLDSIFGLDQQFSRGKRTAHILKLLTHPSFSFFFFFFLPRQLHTILQARIPEQCAFFISPSLYLRADWKIQIPHSKISAILGHHPIHRTLSTTTQQAWVKRSCTLTWSLSATSTGMIQHISLQLSYRADHSSGKSTTTGTTLSYPYPVATSTYILQVT